MSEGRGFEVEAEVKKKPNDWGSGTGCHGRGMGMHAPHSASSSLPACQQAQLKDNKNKANPLDTTNPEGKEKAFHCRLAIKNYLYIQIYRYIVASRPATRLVTNHQKNLETAFWLSLFLATSLFGVAILSYVYIFFVL